MTYADLGTALRGAVRAWLDADPTRTREQLATLAGMAPSNLSRALRADAVVRQPTATALLGAMGLRIALVPIRPSCANPDCEDGMVSAGYCDACEAPLMVPCGDCSTPS